MAPLRLDLEYIVHNRLPLGSVRFDARTELLEGHQMRNFMRHGLFKQVLRMGFQQNPVVANLKAGVPVGDFHFSSRTALEIERNAGQQKRAAEVCLCDSKAITGSPHSFKHKIQNTPPFGAHADIERRHRGSYPDPKAGLITQSKNPDQKVKVTAREWGRTRTCIFKISVILGLPVSETLSLP